MSELQSIRLQRLERYQTFLLEDPDNEHLRADIFELAMDSGNIEIAQAQVDHQLERQAADVGWRYRQARVLIDKSDFFGAEALLDLLIVESGQDPKMLYFYAFSLFGQGKNKEALEPLQYLVENCAQDVPNAMPLLLRCLHKTGDMNRALDFFAGHVEDASLTPEAWGMASLIAIDAERMEQVMPWAERALAMQPRQREGLIAAGTYALGDQDVALAKKYLEYGVDLYPGSGRCWSALGMTYMLNREIEDGRRALEKAVSFMPSHIGTWHGLGWAQIALKDLAAARTAFDAALALDRNFDESHGGLAVVLAMQGDRAGAEQAIERALRLNARCVSALFAATILKGEVTDTQAFRTMAKRVLGQRKTASGKPMLDEVLKHLD